MKKFNPSFTGNLHPHPATVLPSHDPLPNATPPQTAPSLPPPSKPLPTIRTTGREYANPVDYVHPFDSMARFAEALALHYDANRTRHAYYRQLRLIHEHLQCDPATNTEAQLRDCFLFVKLKKQWQPKSIRQAAAAARMFFIDLLQRPEWTVFSQIRTKDHDRLPAVLTRQQVIDLIGRIGEAAVIAKRDHAVIGPLAQRLEARMNGNKFKANTVIAIKLARAVYFMLKSKTVFDPDRLVAALSKN